MAAPIRVAAADVTILDQDDGALPVKLYGPSGAPLLTAAGAVPSTTPAPTVTNLIAPTTWVPGGNYTSADLVLPAGEKYAFFLTITALGGTSPSVTMYVRFRDSQGNTPVVGLNSAAQTATGYVAVVESINTSGIVGSAAIINLALTNVTSISFYVDLIYR